MLNRSASLAMSTSVLKALPGKLDIKRHSPSILYLLEGLNQFHGGNLTLDSDVEKHSHLRRVCRNGRFTFERIHNTKEQIYFYERAEKHKAKERLFESFK